MIAAFAFNGSILLGLVLIPLIYPEALPNQPLAYLMALTVPQPPQPRTVQQPVPVAHINTEMTDIGLVAPRRIPITIYAPKDAEPPQLTGVVGGLELLQGTPDGTGSAFHQAPTPVVHAPQNHSIRVSGQVQEGLLLLKTPPRYPPIAVAARQEGTVVLQAIISKTGTIEKLRVESGPPMLRQAALDAVSSWRYRPYLLSGEPVEVETTVNVVFTLVR
jgi:protein TonB